jgi:low temperature requirement protein LtrA
LILYITPLTAGKQVKAIPPSISHISERIGLFTIIVLGESVVAVVSGISEQDWNFLTSFTALCGLSIAFSFWWMYFDTVDSSALQCMKFGKMNLALSWLYLHLPLVMGLTVTGVSIEHLITHNWELSEIQPEQRLLSIAIASCLLTLAALHWLSCNVGETKSSKKFVYYRAIAGIFGLILGSIANSLSTIILVIILTLICLSQIALQLSDRTI